MTTIGIPVYRSRVAPVFDFSDRVLVVTSEDNRELRRTVLDLKGLPPTDRVSVLARVGVTTLICAGISELSQLMLDSSGIRVFRGIAGQVEEVFAAFLDNRLHEPRFYMPGRRAKYGAPSDRRATSLQETEDARKKEKS